MNNSQLLKQNIVSFITFLKERYWLFEVDTFTFKDVCVYVFHGVVVLYQKSKSLNWNGESETEKPKPRNQNRETETEKPKPRNRATEKHPPLKTYYVSMYFTALYYIGTENPKPRNRNREIKAEKPNWRNRNGGTETEKPRNWNQEPETDPPLKMCLCISRICSISKIETSKLEPRNRNRETETEKPNWRNRNRESEIEKLRNLNRETETHQPLKTYVSICISRMYYIKHRNLSNPRNLNREIETEKPRNGETEKPKPRNRNGGTETEKQKKTLFCILKPKPILNDTKYPNFDGKSHLIISPPCQLQSIFKKKNSFKWVLIKTRTTSRITSTKNQPIWCNNTMCHFL